MKVLQIIFIGIVLLVLNAPKSFSDGLHDDHGSEYIPVDMYSELEEQPPLKLQSDDQVCAKKMIDDTLEIILDFWSNDQDIQLDDITNKADQILTKIYAYMNLPVSYDPQTTV